MSYTVYELQVKPYMTKKSSEDFTFMAKFNNDIPMPYRKMEGFVLKETEKMVYMRCRGNIFEEASSTCMCCGREITNPVSRYFGIGPICGNHNYVNPFSTKEELKKAVEEYRLKLKGVIWQGWIPKSAIIEKKEMGV